MATEHAKKLGKGKTAAESLITATAVAAALILLNVVTCGSRSRLDLTETGIYSLSSASKRMVAQLPEKLQINAYFGNVPAEYADRQLYIENLLEEYADASAGKIVYTRFDVDASDRKEAQERQKQLAEEGVRKLYLISFSEEGNKQVPAYFHVQLSYLDKKETWMPDSGRGFNLEGLEYEFSSRIRRMAFGKKKVGVTRGFGEPDSIQALMQPGADVGGGIRIGLADLYDVSQVDWATQPESIAELDVLIVNGPTEPVSEAAKSALESYVLAGKPAILLVRGMKWQSAGNQMQMMADPSQEMPYMGMPVAHGLDDLLAAWGFEIDKNVIVDGKNSAMGVIPIGNPPLMTSVFFPKVQVLNPGQGGVLAGIPALIMPWASTLKLVGPLAGDAPGFKVEALMRSSPTSFSKGEMILLTRQTALESKDQPKGPFLLGAAAEGEWPSRAGSDKKSPPGTRLVVISGTAFAEDMTFGVMRMVGDPLYLNGFVAMHSLVDWAAEDADLLVVRNKQVLRPIDSLESGERLAIKYGNVAGVPLALVIAGLVFWRVRESRRRRLSL